MSTPTKNRRQAPQSEMNKSKMINPFLFGWQVSKLFKYWAIGAISAVTVATSLDSLGHYLVKLLVDQVEQSLNDASIGTWELWRFGAYYALLTLGQGLVWRTSGFCGQKWLVGVETETYKRLFAHLIQHSTKYFESRFAGALSNSITNAASGLLELLATSLWQFLPLFISCFSNTYVAYLAHPVLAALFGGWLLVLLSINLLLVRKLSRLSFEASTASSDLKGKIVDATTNVSLVQQSSNLSHEAKYIGSFISKYKGSSIRSWRTSEFVLLFNNVMLSAFIATMVGTALYMFKSGAINVGSVVMVITLIGSMFLSLMFIGMVATQAVRHYGRIREGLEEIMIPHDIVDSPTAKPLEVSSGALLFKDVAFSYDDNEVFTKLNINIRAGQRVGLVGLSGAGKSTLVSLLLRQYDIKDGQIFIDDQDISKVTQDSLRKAIALVPQDTTLFHRSIAENIGYGKLEASREDIIEAAKLAQADSFIAELSDNYDTRVGERGIKLSGGQRQRIAIARAFLKNAPILVLDEATSSLDSESETAVQSALTHLFKNRTVIAIAHRLSTLTAMDRIIVLENGCIREDGTHSELLSNKGLYAKLWESQVRGFIQE